MAQQECSTQHEELAEVIGGVELEEFTGEERERLARLRRAVARGERSDRYPVDKRQDFVRWLVDHGKLSDQYSKN